jgi:transposase
MNIQTAETKTKETFFMTEADSLKESTLQKLIAKTVNGTQAAEILGLSVRQVKRLKKRFVKKGIKGILHRNRGMASNHSVPELTRKEITKIIKTSYPDFGPTLACEKLSELHHIVLSTQTIRTLMIGGGLWKVKPMASEKFPHVWRARKDCFGQMQQYDGSYHNWFEGRLKTDLDEAITINCLLTAVDDATGRITYAKFDDSEGVLPTMAFWQEYIAINGKSCSIYLDRFSTYKNNQKKNAVKILELTQFQRACKQAGVEVINANSPQAKGRIERLFQTLQDRLVKEMRLKNISTIAEANIFLIKIFIPWFNKKFAVAAKNSNDIHTGLSKKELLQLPSIFSIHDQRSVMNDYTVMHGGKLYQVDPKQPALVRIGDRITVQTRTNGQIFLFKQNTELRFTEILERPKKVVSIKTEDGRRFGHKPAADHPWQFKQQAALSLKPVLAQV